MQLPFGKNMETIVIVVKSWLSSYILMSKVIIKGTGDVIKCCLYGGKS